MPGTLAFWGCLSGFLAVAAGAFGAHALKATLSPGLLTVFETGARYQMYHALAILAAAWLLDRTAAREARWAGWCFLGGTVAFSGSLYALALTGWPGFGAITPLGGVSFLLGWALLALAARRLDHA